MDHGGGGCQERNRSYAALSGKTSPYGALRCRSRGRHRACASRTPLHRLGPDSTCLAAAAVWASARAASTTCTASTPRPAPGQPLFPPPQHCPASGATMPWQPRAASCTCLAAAARAAPAGWQTCGSLTRRRPPGVSCPPAIPSRCGTCHLGARTRRGQQGHGAASLCRLLATPIP